MTVSASTFCAFVTVGLGTGWIMVDASFANMGRLMAWHSQEGLLLPTHTDIAAKLSGLLVLSGCWVAIISRYSPSFAAFRRLLWTMYIVAFSSAVLEACLWSLSIDGIALFVIVPTGIGCAIGTLSVAVVNAFAPIFFDETVVAAMIAGNGVGGLIAGLLGLLQASVSGFDTTIYMLCIAGLIAVALLAWRHILHHELAFKESTTDEASKTMSKYASGADDEGAALLQPEKENKQANEGWLSILKLSAPLWAIGIPSQTATWGVTFPSLQFATAHAGCDCNTQAELPALTYSIAASSAFILMPCGALLAHFVPVYDLRALAALDVIQMVTLALVMSAVTGQPFMTCSETARITLIVSVAAMRLLDQYIITILYQLAARRFERRKDQVKKTAAFIFGQAMMMPQLVLGTVMFVLIQSRTVRCFL